jgi:ankyrin repeat protein
VSAGANIEAKNNDGKTPLHIASHGGKFEVVKYLKSIGADIKAKDNDGYTPLRLDVKNRRYEVADLLAE